MRKMNKVLVKLYVPTVEKEYDIWIPLNRRIYTVIKLIVKAIKEFLPERDYNMQKYNLQSKFLLINEHGKHVTRQEVYTFIHELGKKLHKAISPHTLRHSFAAHLVQNGADLKSVQEMMGHSDISTTQIYMNMNIHKIRDVYMKAHPRK